MEALVAAESEVDSAEADSAEAQEEGSAEADSVAADLEEDLEVEDLEVEDLVVETEGVEKVEVATEGGLEAADWEVGWAAADWEAVTGEAGLAVDSAGRRCSWRRTWIAHTRLIPRGIALRQTASPAAWRRSDSTNRTTGRR